MFPAAFDMITYLSVSCNPYVILLGLDFIYYLHVPTLSYVSFLAPTLRYCTKCAVLLLLLHLIGPSGQIMYISSVYVE
jgi:hypothetical protein